MKVILQADVKDQGKRGDLVEVSDGYARNYLLPRKLAAEATPGALNEYKAREENKARRAQKEREEAAKLSVTLKDTVVVIKAKGGTAGRLFGSVTAKEIAAALKSGHGVSLDKHRIALAEPLKTAGRHTVQIKLGHELSADMTVEVVAESGNANG